MHTDTQATHLPAHDSISKNLEKLSKRAEFADKPDMAQVFNVSERTIERWTRLRVIPQPRRVGRQRLWHIPTLLKSLAKEAA